jgi:hypothetical protein
VQRFPGIASGESPDIVQQLLLLERLADVLRGSEIESLGLVVEHGQNDDRDVGRRWVAFTRRRTSYLLISTDVEDDGIGRQRARRRPDPP